MRSYTDSIDARVAVPAGTVSLMRVRIADVVVVDIYPFAPGDRVR